MKYLITPIIAISLLFAGCSTFTSDTGITTASTVASSVGLRLVPLSHRAQIANLVDYIATTVRAVTGTPTADQLSQELTAAIPANIKSQFPELISFIVPIVVSNYQLAYTHFGANAAKLYTVLSDVASGLEAGAAPYITSTLASADRTWCVEMTFASNNDKEFRQYLSKVATDLDSTLAFNTDK